MRPAQPMLDRVTAFNDGLARVLLAIGGAGLVAMTLIVGWQVFARYILNNSPSWSEQLTLLLMIWYAMLAAAAGFQQGFHIRIAAFQTQASASGARSMRLLVEALVMASGVLFIAWGIELATIVRKHVIPSLGLSRAWAYAPLPLVGMCMVLFAGTRLVGEVMRPGWTEEAEQDSADHEPEDDPKVAATLRASRASHDPRKPSGPRDPDRTQGDGPRPRGRR